MRTKLAFGAALAIGAYVASAQRAELTFAGLDTDNDNSLSKEEVAAWVKNRPRGGPQGAPNADEVFARWDANKDGAVSQTEFDGRPRPAGPGVGVPPPAR